MRIRKRQAPLPFSSLSPVPLSDPLLNQRSLLVQLQNTTTTTTATNKNTLSPQRPTTDHHLSPRIRDPTNINTTNKDCLELLKDVEGGGEDDDGREKVNESTRICSSRLVLPMVESSNATSLQVRRWGDMGEKAFPFKKRRGSFDKRPSASSSSASNIVVEKDKKILSSSSKPRTMKTKTSKKCVDGETSDVIEEVKGNDNDDNDAETKMGYCNSAVGKQATNSGPKNGKRNRGGTLMEGSRCSRVNGRGWRCCQQTLVGYSLCEHHLGKGRLRSMTSVRSRSVSHHHHSKQPVASSNNLGMSSSSKSKAGHDEGEGDNEGDEKKNVVMITKNNNKRKMKLGVVKARSMSSLLGQGHTCDATNVAYYGNDIDNSNGEDFNDQVIKREGACEGNI